MDFFLEFEYPDEFRRLLNGSGFLRDLSESIFSLTVQSASDGIIGISSSKTNKGRMKVNSSSGSVVCFIFLPLTPTFTPMSSGGVHRDDLSRYTINDAKNKA